MFSFSYLINCSATRASIQWNRKSLRPFWSGVWRVPWRRHSRKGNQLKQESKKVSRLYEAKKFQSHTNICRIKVLETLYLFVLQISKFPAQHQDQSIELKLEISAFPRSTKRILHKMLVNRTQMLIRRLFALVICISRRKIYLLVVQSF